MPLPHYFLPRPVASWDAETLAAFEQLYVRAVLPGAGVQIDYNLAAPKWQFLCYLCEQKHLVLHGSGKMDIQEFEPRKSNDVHAFGDRRAVYAASDGIWPIYFAIVDRDHGVTSLVNSCARIVKDGTPAESFYYFSINGDVLPAQPWRAGMIYILPGDTFEQQPRVLYKGVEIDLAQWASLSPVKPLAKLAVNPRDFPFLDQVQPHDPDVIRRRAQADPDGFPWQEESGS